MSEDIIMGNANRSKSFMLLRRFHGFLTTTSRNLKRRLLRLLYRTPGRGDYAIWKDELPSEAVFWERWIREPAISEQQERTMRLSPTTPLQDWVRTLVNTPAGGTTRLLDVGAGPATVLGKTWPDRTVDITAVDPLADTYNQIFAANGIIPPVRTQRCDGERLSDLFAPDTFDLASAFNALDHSYNPLVIIQGMLELVKPGGWIVLQHAVNEAEEQHYYGLHQWNFCSEAERFVIWNHHSHIIVEDQLPQAAHVRTRIIAGPPKDGIWVEIQKKLA